MSVSTVARSVAAQYPPQTAVEEGESVRVAMVPVTPQYVAVLSIFAASTASVSLLPFTVVVEHALLVEGKSRLAVCFVPSD